MSSVWSQVNVGDAVPPLSRTIELADVVAYAGATWDWHRLHYDPRYLADTRLPAPVVDGQLLGALLAETVQDWLGPSAFIRRLDFRFASPVFAGETVRCHGTVSAVDADTLTLAMQVLVDGEPTRAAVTPATAVVERYR